MSKRSRDSSDDDDILDVSCDAIQYSPPESVIISPEGSPSRIGVAPASLNDGNFDCNSVSFTESELFFSVVNESADQSAVAPDFPKPFPSFSTVCGNTSVLSVEEHEIQGDPDSTMVGPLLHRLPPHISDKAGLETCNADVTMIMDESCFENDDDDSHSVSDSSGWDNVGEASELSFDSEEDEREIRDPGNPPIYRGAQITVNESMTAILSYLVRHEISGKQLIDLLGLINLHCREEENKMISSLYLFKKYFSILDCPVIYHYYCSHCYAKIAKKSDGCPNQNIHPELNQKCIFVELPLQQQLQDLLSREEFVSNIGYGLKRKKSNPLHIEDVHDGQLYRELIASGFISESNPFNMSGIMNADGVPVFFSTKDSLWPIFLNILELPPNLRFKQENTIIAGLWFGAKPSVNLMLSPLLPSFQKLKTGFEVKPYGCETIKVAKCVVLVATADLPAKAMLLGMSGHSGSFGCQICKIKGNSVKIVKKVKKNTREKKGESSVQSEEVVTSSVWVFPFSESLDLRNLSETLQFGKHAQEVLLSTKKQENIMGVKFRSAIFSIMYDAVRGFAINDLHTLYLGVIRSLINLWFDSKNSCQPFSLRKHLSTVDHRLKTLKLPNFLERGVSTIEDQLSFWKGKDYLVWAHYLSIPVLDGVMPSKYLEHYIDLVNCLQILQSTSISQESLLHCDQTLKKYVKEFENLYGSRHMTMVVHLVLHLVYVVNNLGPLRTLSCFPYENLNGLILKMIHGTRYVETQLASACYFIRQLPLQLKSSALNERTRTLCDIMLHPSKRLKVLENIGPAMFSVGTYHDIPSPTFYVTAALQKKVDFHQTVSIKSFLKLKKDNMLYVARSYSRCVTTNSSTCSFFEGDILKYGVIDIFVKVSLNEQILYFAIVETAEVSMYVVGSKTVASIKECELSGCFTAVPVTNIASMLVYLTVENRAFICDTLDHTLKS